VTAAPQIKGWCPSAWRPMLSGDGYLLRLHFSCGIVTSGQARALADLAQRYGNGRIDLTRRANLQIRGVAEERTPELQAALLAEKLIADDAAGEGMPNVIASPLAGRDREALIDIRPLVRELEARFAADPRTRDLPGKFCVIVEDGGHFPLHDLPADIAFEACEQDSGVRFVVRIGDASVGLVETEEVAETALAIAAAFIKLRNGHAPHARRMRDLVDKVGLPAITTLSLGSGCTSTKAKARRQLAAGGGRPGDDALGRIGEDVFGVAAPFGSLRSEEVVLLSDLAEYHGEGELRLTPWRAFLLPAIASGAIDRVKAECERAGLVTRPSDPRRHIEACTGAPACASASVSTRSMAVALAPLLGPDDTLHVSGCAKACASSAAACVTLVGRDGRFDLVRNGRTTDTPALFGLSAEEARIAIERTVAEEFAHL
jgi:precorrin-3B synthase